MRTLCLLALLAVPHVVADPIKIEDPDPEPPGFAEWFVNRTVQFVRDFNTNGDLGEQIAYAQDLADDINGQIDGMVVCLRDFTPWQVIEQVDLVPKITQVDPSDRVVLFSWVGTGRDIHGAFLVGEQVYEIRGNAAGLQCSQYLPNVPDLNPPEADPWSYIHVQQLP